MSKLGTGCSLLLVAALLSACAKEPPTAETASESLGDHAATSSAARGGSDDSDGQGGRLIEMVDDCAASDGGWNAVGGCTLRKGTVTFAEFNVELSSTLAPTSVIGHPSWRNDPSYLAVREGRSLRVRNVGGRAHTFTRVVDFGGGKVPNAALNKGLVQAPECPDSKDILPGESAQVAGLAPGNNRYQCCIHPWMRAIVKVQ